MGIVVTIVMLLGVFAQLPFTRSFIKDQHIIFIGRLLLIAGLWNALWFGLRHLDVFWGQAALISGLAMIFSSVLIARDYEDPLLAANPLWLGIYRPLKAIAPLIIALLVISAGLYLITLIRLNLGLSIIQ